MINVFWIEFWEYRFLNYAIFFTIVNRVIKSKINNNPIDDVFSICGKHNPTYGALFDRWFCNNPSIYTITMMKHSALLLSTLFIMSLIWPEVFAPVNV